MEKNLPIKIFRKRDNDRALNNLAVMGENTGQRIKLEGDALINRVNYFRSYFSKLSEKLQLKLSNNNYLPTVIKLKISDKALYYFLFFRQENKIEFCNN